MLYTVKSLYQIFILPPGCFFILLAFFSLWLWRRDRLASRILVMFLFLFYIFSTDFMGNLLIRSLEIRYMLPKIEELQGDVIVMLGGGATSDTPNVHGIGHLSGFAANRLITAAELYKVLKVPIVVSGGQVFADTGVEAKIAKSILVGLGVPEEKVYIEDQSLNTTENARFTKALMQKHEWQQPILVTSAFHMDRSVTQFYKADILPVPYPTDYQTNITGHFSWRQLLPTANGLYNSSLALKEYIGLWAVNWY